VGADRALFTDTISNLAWRSQFIFVGAASSQLFALSICGQRRRDKLELNQIVAFSELLAHSVGS
jgi:hypothetical protein